MSADSPAGELTQYALAAVYAERERQDAKHPEPVLARPDGTGHSFHAASVRAKALTDSLASQGQVTWRHILDEEVAEAYAETDPAKLRAELVQVAAVAVAWVEAIDRRNA